MSSVSSRLMRNNDASAAAEPPTANVAAPSPSAPPARMGSFSKKGWMMKRSGSVSKRAAAASSAHTSYISSTSELAFLSKQLTNVREGKLAEQLFDEKTNLLAQITFDNKGLTLDELHLCAVILLERSAPRAIFSDRTGLQLLFDLVQTVRAVYRTNPYHDFRHCVDVMQFAFFLLAQEDVREMAEKTPEVARHADDMLFVLLVACLLHDAGHDGLTNTIHRKLENDALVQRFGPESTLERLHYSYCSDLVPKSRILDRLSTSAEVLSTCEMLILSTDMEKHRALLAAFHVEPSDHLFALVIKMADISNVTRDFEEAKCWAKRLEAETREHPGAAAPAPAALGKSVVGFANLFALPLAEVFIDIGLVQTGTLLKSRILANNAVWEEEETAGV